MSRSALPSTATLGESSRPRASPVPKKDDDAHRQKILVLGWRKAGKTSCIKTVFQQVPAKEVPYFGVTQKIEKINYDSIVPLQIWDTPSNFELDQLDVPVSSFSTIVYVLDMQQDDSYHESILRFVHIMVRAYLSHPGMRFHMFIHKSEVLSEDYRGENYAEIQRATSEEIEDFPYKTLSGVGIGTGSLDLEDPGTTSMIINQLISEIRFSMTSVHDVTLRDAWSRVLQGGMEMLPAVESLLLDFTSHSSADNTFLFDINSGIILATDNRHRTDELSEQVTEYLKSFLQFRELYKNIRQLKSTSDGPNASADQKQADGGAGDDGEEDEVDGSEDGGATGWWDDEDPDAPWMTQSTRLLPTTTLALWQFTPFLALVVLLRTETWQARRGTIEYNLTFLRQGVREILSVV
ncbi:hypothetical protein I317_02932 [Kwoniella heveanensis CBS 569]|uniref:GTP-binding protein n=1 Tax=Kwoniella heveanensis BCC8398 TaxID=1296120 RepID=A0A1B9GLF8_9TREE|nr:hypothetical protein I316_06486 [Kwoniella heveanensis BCC8398]OCF43224.1 hypothetical protein I317_02932 [Kwoniella heveanensis CBS 569]